MGTEITFKEAETVKAFLADPSAFAAVAAPAAAAAAPAAAAAAAPPPKEESEEEMMTWALASSTDLCRPNDDCRSYVNFQSDVSYCNMELSGTFQPNCLS